MDSYGLPDLSKCQFWTESSRDEDECLTYDQAVNFVSSREWFLGIKESYVGILHPGLVSVFLFRIHSNRNDLPEWAWVVVGNLPHVCFPIKRHRNPALALSAYINALRVAAQAENIDRNDLLSIPDLKEISVSVEAMNHLIPLLEAVLDAHLKS